MDLTKEEIQRYSRQLQLPGWGVETQLKLKTARILVIGAGALGCAVLQNLSLAGVGTLGIADDDIVSLTNLQRQVLFDVSDIGSSKAQTAKNKIEKLNPFVKVELFGERIFEGNVLSILKEYDVIVDGSDNFETKYLLNDACVILNKPLVSGSIEGFEGQVAVFNFMDGPTYRCLFPEQASKENTSDCNTIGVTTT
ncbi:MAG: HesA/MoeB/ThiF family protein, partial [Bacteroidia bacterium]|nr:HesA/MoeB/ThiF family protein [Bacteroidia bacterium]